MSRRTLLQLFLWLDVGDDDVGQLGLGSRGDATGADGDEEAVPTSPRAGMYGDGGPLVAVGMAVT